jgi:hypothetical protein
MLYLLEHPEEDATSLGDAHYVRITASEQLLCASFLILEQRPVQRVLMHNSRAPQPCIYSRFLMNKRSCQVVQKKMKNSLQGKPCQAKLPAPEHCLRALLLMPVSAKQNSIIKVNLLEARAQRSVALSSAQPPTLPQALHLEQASTLPISIIRIPALFAIFSAGKARHSRHFFR